MATQQTTTKPSQHIAEHELPAYIITYDDGTNQVVSMADGITLEEARAYYVGQSFVDEDPATGRETTRTAVAVVGLVAGRVQGMSAWIVTHDHIRLLVQAANLYGDEPLDAEESTELWGID